VAILSSPALLNAISLEIESAPLWPPLSLSNMSIGLREKQFLTSGKAHRLGRRKAHHLGRGKL
jgi:hypothetical protein